MTAQLIESRPVLRPAEVLEFVPGVIVTQHSGGGKANQYFLRGFNLGIAEATVGGDGYRRALPVDSHEAGDGAWLYALEASRNDGLWDSPEDFGRVNGVLRFSAYTIRSEPDLWSNFSYLLDNPADLNPAGIAGDQFRQSEQRTVFGLRADHFDFDVASSIARNAGSWFGHVKLHHFGPRPLTEDNSQRSASTTLVNLRVGYRVSRDLRLALTAGF